MTRTPLALQCACALANRPAAAYHTTMPRIGSSLVLFASSLFAQAVPSTVPEATNHVSTSRVADVEKFLAACTKLPHGNLLRITVAGTSHGGRNQPLVHIADSTASGARVRVLVIGNIHAGEVEGKEALQVLVREFALGQHRDLLQHCDLQFLPIYNADGNEQLGSKNREGQNGPDLAGQRPNGQGLDLNRDFVKADAPETRTLLGLFRSFDPHVFIDLHTTNGSYHGYHLTFAPCLSTSFDPELQRLSRSLLDESRAAMLSEHHFATFDYGNFETRDWEQNGAPESPKGARGWYTYDHRARYGINYFGLRNRISILSEAYSYADFATRIAAVRAFVLTLLRRCSDRKAELIEQTTAADGRTRNGTGVSLGFESTFAEPESLPILVGEVETIPAADGKPTRHVRKGDGKPETMNVCRTFRARQQRPLPHAWALLAASPAAIERLQLHGIEFTRLEAAGKRRGERFAVSKKRKPKRPYQGHQELMLTGSWEAAAELELPVGTVLVSAQQPLARLAAVLLEPESEDSLSTWNFFEANTDSHYPVLRLSAQ